MSTAKRVAPGKGLDPRVARMKHRLLTAPYEVCMARALHFTRSYRETEGQDPALRNALALKRTLERQAIRIEPDEHLAGSKTERFLAGPLSVERGDFLRGLQLEIEVLPHKQRPFSISEQDKRLFYDEVLPYWDGRTVRDRKAADWQAQGLIDTEAGVVPFLRRTRNAIRHIRSLDPRAGEKLLGARRRRPQSLRELKNLVAMRHELARNNPTPAVFCFDVQGHLSLGVDKVVTRGIGAIVRDACKRLERLQRDEPGNARGRAFLEAVVISLEAAIHYAERFADLADELASNAAAVDQRRRLKAIARQCRRVPCNRPRSFREALQAAWFTLLVGEIQYGTHEVFAVGRMDQYLAPFYERDSKAGKLDRGEAMALLQEFFLKQTANAEPIPEVGMETNAVLGNSQHVVTIGGLTPDGEDATNELTYLMLDAFEQMGGCLNQLSVRVAPGTPDRLLRRTAEVFRRANGIALYNDQAVVEGLLADGMSLEDARDYCIVGCIETSGQSDTHGCPGGHELVLPAVLLLTLSQGADPRPAAGQQAGYDSGDPEAWRGFDDLFAAFGRQLAHQVEVQIEATAAKDRAYRDILPAPYVSALMADCIERARDCTDGGARYDFTSLDVRGLATTIDSLLAIETVVYEREELALGELLAALERNFEGQEPLRQRLLTRAPKYGAGHPEAGEMTRRVLGLFSELLEGRCNERGGGWRMCYYSYGNHVIDGLMLGATPDGRKRGEPISNGVSPTNQHESHAGVAGPLRQVAAFPPEQVSSGVSLNMRFHPAMLRTEEGTDTYARMIRTYFNLGGMHLQPNVIDTEILRAAQQDPEQYRDLVVKVSGYSAYFCDLGRSIQEDIIAREEFGIGGGP